MPLEKIEEKNEYIPSSDEVLSIFERLAGESRYETVRKLEDEKGLYLWEIRISQEDGDIEYSYTRKGKYKGRGLLGGSASETAVHVTFFSSNGTPISGYSILKFIDGKWKETP
jgi:hypothetical protein